MLQSALLKKIGGSLKHKEFQCVLLKKLPIFNPKWTEICYFQNPCIHLLPVVSILFLLQKKNSLINPQLSVPKSVYRTGMNYGCTFYVMFLGSSIEEKKVLGYKYFFIELTPPHIFMENCQNGPVNSWYFFVMT